MANCTSPDYLPKCERLKFAVAETVADSLLVASVDPLEIANYVWRQLIDKLEFEAENKAYKFPGAEYCIFETWRSETLFATVFQVSFVARRFT